MQLIPKIMTRKLLLQPLTQPKFQQFLAVLPIYISIYSYWSVIQYVIYHIKILTSKIAFQKIVI